jgi:hypothetical protein
LNTEQAGEKAYLLQPAFSHDGESLQYQEEPALMDRKYEDLVYVTGPTSDNRLRQSVV